MSAIMKFDEDFYECCKYKRGCLVNEIDQSTVRKNYEYEFDIKLFVDEFIKSLIPVIDVLKVMRNVKIKNIQ